MSSVSANASSKKTSKKSVGRSAANLKKRLVKNPRTKKPFDKYEYYLKSVQSPEADAELLRQTYREIRGKPAVSMREDFCAAFALSCAWVEGNGRHHGIAVDLDPEPLAYGKEHYFTKLSKDQQSRLKILQGNVLDKKLPKADIVAALNFSYFIFKERDTLKKYFKNVLRTLNKDGLLVIDLFGGPDCMASNEDHNKFRGFSYFWRQEGYDPITHHAVFHIDFKIDGVKRMNSVFSYDWRMWTIPELRELLVEAGFQTTHVYWEGTTKSGRGNGIFKRTEKGEEGCDSFVAYIVAEK